MRVNMYAHARVSSACVCEMRIDTRVVCVCLGLLGLLGLVGLLRLLGLLGLLGCRVIRCPCQPG